MSGGHHHQHAGHGHHGHGHPHVAPDGTNRAFAIGIALNLGFVGIEGWYGWQAGSLALLADAAHNLSDVAGLVLAWAGLWASRLKADERHTYGWQRASILAAFLNAVLLLVAMGSLGWEAVQRLSQPTPVAGMTVMVVAGIGIVINGLTALMLHAGSAHDLNIRGAFLHMVADALVSLGVVGVGALTMWQGWDWLDPVTSLAIAALIVAGTWGLLRQSVHLLFDGVPDHVPLVQVRALLLAQPGVTAVSDLHVWGMSTSQVALTAHLVMPGHGAPRSAEEGHEVEDGDAFVARVSALLRERFGIAHVTLQRTRAAVLTGCEPADPPAHADHDAASGHAHDHDHDHGHRH